MVLPAIARSKSTIVQVFRLLAEWFRLLVEGATALRENFAELRWGSPWTHSKFLSLLLLSGATAAVLWLHQVDSCFVYREDVHFTNFSYLDPEELYRTSSVDGWSIFWLQPEQVQKALVSHPYVADAQVTIELPAQLTIQITEQEPVALWRTDAGTLWLLEDGTALTARHDRSQGLLEIVDGQAAAREISFKPMVAMDPEVLANARKLAKFFPSLRVVMFHEGIGINFSSPNSGLWVYWGDGDYFETKLKNLLTIESELTLGRIRAELIDVRLPEKPIVR